MKTIHELRSELEQAQAAYLAADIEHPTAVSIAKDNLTNARFNYWAACADLLTRIPGAIRKQFDVEREGELAEIYEEVTGEEL